MMQATRQQVEPVAKAVVGDLAIEFYDDGSAVMAAALTIECTRCSALHDLEGVEVSFTPDLAWHLLQAVRQHLPPDAYRQAQAATSQAIGGPES
jgi:hypothetical protein